ncbi:hypothetical protein QIA04_07305 (plasmid) [Borreliella burgdorferi]|uniref:hypothetical protein n=1 Tax=Borreliella burgdorferi TaxID=139 RepID=UPI00016B3111|nr:hypothetical protein [Borreliella burgdorferi]MCR8876398.1 hypothetical protein [Borreliella burgdorferi]MCS2182203.1 hypothetical protein [Borreliella burgdorferi]PRQ97695.1 hypothetical protein CV681_05500 [Borreliella burgdorferi]PRR10919.1 hypothetical protein CV660_05395 [Borreliella burgdorferi]PRR17083.1 hypothetical protein CV651_05290 [Borreliella burgdorferi]
MFDFVISIGTFLPEVIKIILNEIPIDSEKQEDYINFHILKNVYGFECLMVPYVVDHLKPSQYLKEKFVATA